MAKDPSGAVRVWGEVGLTLPVGENMAYVKVMFGHERIAPDSSQATLRATRDLIDEFNQEVVEKQVEKYTRLAKAVESGARSGRSRRR